MLKYYENYIKGEYVYSRLDDSICKQKDDCYEFRKEIVNYVYNYEQESSCKELLHFLPLVLFLYNNNKDIAFTDDKIDIYMNPNHFRGEISSIEEWEFIFCHECYHQVWDTFDVQKRIGKELGGCYPNVLNIASDCVINETLKASRRKAPSMVITAETIKRDFDVDYEDYDTQYSLYMKIINSDKFKQKQEEQKQKQQQGNNQQQQQGGNQDQQGNGAGSNNQQQDNQQQQQGGDNQQQQGGNQDQQQQGSGGKQQQKGGKGGSGNSANEPLTNNSSLFDYDEYTGDDDNKKEGNDSSKGKSDKDSSSQDKDKTGNGKGNNGEEKENKDGKENNGEEKESDSDKGENEQKGNSNSDNGDVENEEDGDSKDSQSQGQEEDGDGNQEKDSQKSNGNNSDEEGKGSGEEGEEGGYGREKAEKMGGRKIITREELEKIHDQAVDMCKNKLGGMTGKFMEKCNSSSRLENPNINQAKIKQSFGGSGSRWDDDLLTIVTDYLEETLYDPFPDTRRSYAKYNRHMYDVKRRSGGKILIPGQKIEDKTIHVKFAFFYDGSGSMGGPRIQGASLAANAIANVIDKNYGDDLKDMKEEEDSDEEMFEFYTFYYDKIVKSKRNETPFADGGTMPYKELFNNFKKYGTDCLINIVFTDADQALMNGDEEYLQDFIDANDGLIVYIVCGNVNQDLLQRLADQNEGKFNYIRSDNNFLVENDELINSRNQTNESIFNNIKKLDFIPLFEEYFYKE